MHPQFTYARSGPGCRVLAYTFALAACTVTPLLSASAADVTLSPVSIGGGMRTSYTHTAPDSGEAVDDFNLDSARLYINGSVTDTIKFMFNTEYTGSPPSGTNSLAVPSGTNSLEVLDAVARFEFSDKFNIWAGRFLPPSDRANLYGPYYANDWNPYADGVADFYPCTAVGRDNGVAYWGQFGIAKVSAGLFDGPSVSGCGNPINNSVISAMRVQLDFWDPEGGYYLNGTYYGEKDLLAVGFAGQSQGGNKSYSVDGLFEKKLGGAGAVTVETEYQKDQGLINESKGYYVLTSYIFPQEVGIGKFQPLIKYSKKTTDHGTLPDTDVKTTELNLNYIIKTFNARVSLFYLSQKLDPAATTDKKYGLGVQLQM